MDIHSQLHTVDFVVIAVYAVLVIGLGMAISYRRLHTRSERQAARQMHTALEAVDRRAYRLIQRGFAQGRGE